MKFASILAFAAFATGCAAAAPPAPVSTTQTTAAEVTISEDASHSSQAQKTSKLTDEQPLAKDGDKRDGNGFSGWK